MEIYKLKVPFTKYSALKAQMKGVTSNFTLQYVAAPSTKHFNG
jgi:hypothetical protein